MATISEDLVFSISDEIGTEISSVRLKDKLEDRQYFTGIEIAALIGTGVLVSFCTALIKSISERIGEELGEHAADAILAQLHKIKSKIHETSLENEINLVNQVSSYQSELDAVITAELPKLIRNRVFSEELNAAYQGEIQEVTTYLIDSGFTPEKSSSYSVRIVKRIQQEWPYELS